MKQVDNMYDGILIGHFDCLRTRDDVICTSFEMCDSFLSSAVFRFYNRQSVECKSRWMLAARDAMGFAPFFAPVVAECR